ncbi:hypothetical protein OS493_004332 [Desmophyllum pertusum]|uniref:Active breakpoint cluster region-related protein n=1 Tax=Desmophyllum pertusum TaxID=174260 RepID=A0A9X0D5K5_9CNID|nr:hypothetical protein OS493_004332 [Desmophyllum pertusum]
MSFANQEEAMDQREAFLTAWRNFFPKGKLPDTDFLQCCGCGGDSASNEQILERFNLCKERLENAISVIKSEGFVLKWLTEVLNVKVLEQSDSELDKVLNFFFPSALDQSCTDPNEQDSVAIQPNGEERSEFHNFKDVPLSKSENGNLLNACDLNEERKTINTEAEAGFPLNEPDFAVDGSELHADIQGTSGVNSGKLFSRENNGFDGEKSSLHDDINIAEGNKLSANNNTETGSENDVRLTRTNEERSPTGSSEEEYEENMEDESHELNSPEREKPAGLKNRTFATVFSPLAKGINKAKLKGKWHLARSTGAKHKRSDSHESTTSGEDVDFSNHTESETFENLDREVLSDTGEVHSVNSNDICTANHQDNMAADGDGLCLAPSCRIERDHVDFARQGTSENNAVEKEDTNSQEDRCEATIEESPDVIIEVVDELISYLEGIEVVSSDELEGESPHISEGDDFMLFGGVIRPRKPLRSRKQLDSVLSLGNVSLMSADSCVSPWSIDVAACEMQSADSSEQEDNASCDYSEARPSVEASPSLPNAESTKQPAGQGTGTPPPIRPPRRSKTERRSRTVGSPMKLGAISTDDDEVFGKDDKGYEGDYETLTRSSQLTSRLPKRSASDAVRPRSQNADNDDHRKLRKARGSHVVIGDDNVDFPSSPVPSPSGSPAKHADPSSEGKAEKLHKRKWVVAAVLDGEKGYLECLNMLYKHMKPLKLSIESSAPILTSVDYNKIFHKLDELHTIHTVFYNDLEARVDQFDVYREYILNYKTALSTIRKCKTSNEQFNNIFSKELNVHSIQEVTTLEGLFSKPVERVGRYIVCLGDLIKQTPDDHADYELLTNVLNSTKEFLARISGDDRDGGSMPRVKRDHRLIKDGFIVELADGVRKFRHLFLFNDYILCTKRKITARSEQYVCKWYVSLHEIQFHPTESSEAAQVIPVTSKVDFDLLKSKIASTKAEIRREEGVSGFNSPDSSPSSKRRRAQSASKIVEKMKKRLAEQEAALLLAVPCLPLTVYHKQGKTYTLLCKTGGERADWKEAIIPLLEEKSDNPTADGQLSMIELHHLLEACKKLRTCRSLGKVSMKEDKSLLNGLLYVHIHSGRGFHKNDLSCVVEIDHYGQFVRKAKTRTCKASTEPVWDQDFDVEVEGTRELKLHVYCKSRLNRDEHCAQGKIELLKEDLKDLKKRTITITLDKQGAVTLSLQYSKTPQGIQRKKSLSEKGVFGVDIATVSRREESDIPLVVIGCVQEIERRGMEEVGIYRLSGATSEVRRLKEAFDNNSQSALVQVAEADIHAVAGLLKMYLRDLPEPVFTDDLYPKFVEANGIKDPEEKKKAMMELFESLPTPNRLTCIYLLDHLRRLSEHQEQNKMGQNNLATVFGPNILRPSSSATDPTDLARGTLDVMNQVGIFLWFIKFSSHQLPADPELMHRLDPRKGTDAAPAPDRQDRLI